MQISERLNNFLAHYVSCSALFVFLTLCLLRPSFTNVELLEPSSNEIENDAEEKEAQDQGPVQRDIDWAYSPIDLMQLAQLEQDLYNEFGTVSKTEKQKTFIEKEKRFVLNNDFLDIHWWLQDFRESTLKYTQHYPENTKQMAAVASHPFLTLRMIKRYERLSDILNSDLEADQPIKASDFFEKIKEFVLQVKLPTASDVENVMKSILEIQFTYDFKVDELLTGKFGDVDTGFGPRLDEAYEIGLQAYKEGKFPEALDWLETVYFKLQESRRPSHISNDTLFYKILEVSKTHDEQLDTITKDNYSYFEHYHLFTEKITSGRPLVTMKEADTAEFERTRNVMSFPSYTVLCAGKEFLSETDRAKLTCWLDTASDPSWRINPLKMEVHSWDPYIVQFYDVISEKLINRLKVPALEQMERAGTANYAEDNAIINTTVTYYRTSSSAILQEREEEELGSLLEYFNKLIGRMTGLVVSNFDDPYFSASEQLQIASYAFGGSFMPHVDGLGSGQTNTDFKGLKIGDRVATFMTYLNNVHRGGYTVFPLLGISVVPKKGSALFWYGLYKNGTIDRRTLHAGCPVILGQKWIATKWIRLFANFQKRRCSLNSLE